MGSQSVVGYQFSSSITHPLEICWLLLSQQALHCLCQVLGLEIVILALLSHPWRLVASSGAFENGRQLTLFQAPQIP